MPYLAIRSLLLLAAEDANARRILAQAPPIDKIEQYSALAPIPEIALIAGATFNLDFPDNGDSATAFVAEVVFLRSTGAVQVQVRNRAAVTRDWPALYGTSASPKILFVEGLPASISGTSYTTSDQIDRLTVISLATPSGGATIGGFVLGRFI